MRSARVRIRKPSRRNKEYPPGHKQPQGGYRTQLSQLHSTIFHNEVQKAVTNEELVAVYQQGNNDVLATLYMQNIGLIEVIARKYQAYAEHDDLMQESYFAVIRAAALWEPDRGASFAHYLTYWLKQVMQRYVDDNGLTVRVPVHQRSRMRQYERIRTSYKMQFGTDPSDRELCAALDLTEKQLEELRRDVHALRIRSTSEVVGGDDDDILLGDTIPDDHDHIDDVVDRIHKEELADAVWNVVDALPKREAEVLHGRYEKNLRLRECAADLGISVERVRQLEAMALRKLRKGKSAKVLSAYLTESGARSLGLRQTGLSAFRHNWTSSQEAAIIRLEQYERERRYQCLE